MLITTLNLPDGAGGNITKDLFNGAWCRGARIGGTSMPPLSLLYAATSIRTARASERFVDAVWEGLSGDAVLRRLEGSDVVVAHTSNYTLADDRKMLSTLRAGLGCRIALFGNLDGAVANELVANNVADWVCCGDPEEAFAELGSALTGSDDRAFMIAGLHSAGVLEPARRPLGDLDDKPVPDRTPILGRRYRNPLAVTSRWTTALTSRGCPFNCGFCNTPGYYGRNYRLHSLEYVLDELRCLSRMGWREIFFRDDIFRAGHVEEFCEGLLRTDLRLKWSCNHRVDTLNEKTLALMRDSGCHTVKFGVESGDDEILAAIGKPCRRRAEETFDICRRLGIRTHAHLMIGLPGETTEQIESTVRLLKRIEPYSFSMGMFTPHPGSLFYERLGSEGVVVGGAWKDRVQGNPSAVADDELDAILRRTYLSYYLSPRRMFLYARDFRKWAELADVAIQMLRRFAGGGGR